MRLSSRARYGLRAVVDLAERFGGDPVPLGAIASRGKMSRKYLHAIFTVLKSAGFVRSVRGTEGGYVLTRKPSQIRLNEILEALEGSLSPSECVDDAGVCERSSQCVTREIWRDIGRAIDDVLCEVTLEDLVRRNQKCGGSGPPMYHI